MADLRINAVHDSVRELGRPLDATVAKEHGGAGRLERFASFFHERAILSPTIFEHLRLNRFGQQFRTPSVL